MQIKGRDYQVLYTKESKEVQVAIVPAFYGRTQVVNRGIQGAEGFPDTLHPTADKSPKGTRTEGRKPLRQAAASTCKLYGRGRKRNTLNPDCIEDEIYKLFNELYPKE